MKRIKIRTSRVSLQDSVFCALSENWNCKRREAGTEWIGDELTLVEN
ncbi:MAG: hypothetical protein WDZ29_01445 [Balneolaceae bacterium]